MRRIRTLMGVRFGIIGAGKAGVLHADGILAVPRAEVAWVADPDRDRGRLLASRCRARHVSDFHDALAAADAVSICVPHAMLAETAIAAARAGVHVLLEKPMAVTLADADRVLEAARAARVVLMIGFVHRYRPEVQRAFALVRAGAIGEPRFVADHSVGGGMSGWPAWVRRAGDGGGSVLYSGVHRIDRARWLLGREVSRVSASTAALLPGSDADSSHAALLTFDDGAGAALTHFFHRAPVPSTWATDIHGDAGVLRVATGVGLELITAQGTSREEAGPDRRFENEIKAFLDAIEGRPAAIPRGEDGRAVLAIALAILESGATGRTLTLETPVTGHR